MTVFKSSIRATGVCALLVLASACSRKEGVPAEAPLAAEVVEMQVRDVPPPPPPPSAAAPAADSAADAPAANAVSAAPPSQQLASRAATYTDSERKFIRTANARFGVKDVYVAALAIEDTVGSHGGFVVKNDISAKRLSSQSHPIADHKLMELTEYSVQGHLIVRVPSAKTQEFLRAIVNHIVFLDERNFSARDAQFDLLRAQLEITRNNETQSDLGDAVKEGGKLVQKTDAIAARDDVKAARDAALLQRKEFDDQVAFSTIDLTLYQPSRLLQSERADVDSLYRQARPSFLQRFGEQARSGWDSLLGLVLGLVSIWPVLLIGGLLVAGGVRLKRRWRKTAPAAE